MSTSCFNGAPHTEQVRGAPLKHIVLISQSKYMFQLSDWILFATRLTKINIGYSAIYKTKHEGVYPKRHIVQLEWLAQ